MNCALQWMSDCTNVRATGHEDAGVHVTLAMRAVLAKAGRNAERHFE
jgi:hypothetical protein